MTEEKVIPKTNLIGVILQIASVWVLSDIGYYIFLPALGFNGGYNVHPVQITIYYLIWTIIAIFAFKDILKDKVVLEKRLGTYIPLVVGNIFIVIYVFYILPLLPTITWTPPWMPPSELLNATTWYFLPKSIEIFLQQILLLALVISFLDNQYKFKTTAIWCALLFGGSHLLLVFSGGFMYATVFTIIAVVASFIFTYLLLEVRNGFLYSYFLHWIFYAFVVVVTKLIFKV
ncbi:MAG: hypothetical protein AB201_02215 [Parcubacteria bacterium C7867-006]|nr:MAG: hypothetical protein AB201_02215 [Parcubacteria bacterium C7867-006]